MTVTATNHPPSRVHATRWLALVVLAGGWLLYGRTMAPGLLFGDAGELQFALPLGGLIHPTGYPLFGALGWLWTQLTFWWPEPATRANAFSAFWAGLALALFFLATQQMLLRVLPAQTAPGRWLCGLCAAFILAVSPTWWSQATIAEVYTFHAVLTLSLFNLLLRWAAAQRAGQAQAGRWLIAAAGVFGLGLTHHQTMLLLAPAIVLFILRVQPGLLLQGRRLALLLLCVTLPLLLYLTIPWRAANSSYVRLPLSSSNRLELYQPGLDGLAQWATGVRFASALRTPAAALAQLPQALTWTQEQFGLFGLALAILGVSHLLLRQRRGMLTLTGAIALAVLAFNLFYGIGDIAVLYISLYLIIGIWLAVGLAAFAQAVQRITDPANRTLGRSLTAALPALLLVWPLLALGGRFAVFDQSQNRAAETFWDRIFSQPLPANAILISNDRDEMTPLIYHQVVRGEHRDLTGLFPAIAPGAAFSDVARVVETALSQGKERPVVLVKPMPGLEVKFQLVELGQVMRVEGLAVTRTPERPLNADLGEALQLLGYSTDPNHQLRAGGALQVALYWQPRQKLDGDYTGFVQLLDATGAKIAQGQDHPVGSVFYPTGLWRPGEMLRDVFTLTLPANLQPGAYTLTTGMYRREADSGALRPLAAPLTLGKIGLLPDLARPAAAPDRPLNVELADRILLLGYSLRRSDTALEVVLQWQAARYVENDLTVFVHLLGPDGVIAAQHDGQPAEGLAATSIWPPGQAIRDEHRLLLPHGLRPGVYTLVCGMYDAATSQRLAITEGPGAAQKNTIFLQEVAIF